MIYFNTEHFKQTLHTQFEQSILIEIKTRNQINIIDIVMFS